MSALRNRARLFAAVALMWHVIAIAAVSIALSCHSGSGSAGMEDCPLHESAPACPRHGEQHGTHDCDCPTIGCSQTDAGFMALFGAVGIIPAAPGMPIPNDAGDASHRASVSADIVAFAPLSPPPRA